MAMVAVLLSAVFVVVAVDVRERVRATVTDKLEAGQRMLSALEQRRGDDLVTQVAMLAENPTLKAALDIYQSELTSAKPASQPEMVATVARELEKLSARLQPDVLAVTDASGRTIAKAGRLKTVWPARVPTSPDDDAHSRFLSVTGGTFRLASAYVVLQDSVIGTLQLATAIDDQYARELSALSGASALIATPERIVSTTLPGDAVDRLSPDVLRALATSRIVTLGASEYAVRELLREGDAGVYVLDSIDGSAGPELKKAVQTIVLIAIGAFALAGIASIWLARTVARPIDRLSRSLSDMTRGKTFDEPIKATGSSLEIDALTSAFNDMMRAVRAAEDETRSAYVGTIRALAMALDARDPYTAGHSERVSALSVAVGRHMSLGDEDLEVLRLGALLHDIGKIGVPRRGAAEAGRADRGGVRDDQAASGAGRPDPAQRAVPGTAHSDRRAPPRAPGRQRLPAPAARRRDPAPRTHRPRHRRVRRDDERARVSSRPIERRGVARALAVRRRRVRRGDRAGACRDPAVNGYQPGPSPALDTRSVISTPRMPRLPAIAAASNGS